MGKNLRCAFKLSIPILIGLFPVGIAYGFLMSSSGYNFIWSALCCMFVFAGSLQYLMVSFFAGGVSLLSIIAMSLLLNSRHIFYGLSFIEKFKSYGWKKWLLIFALSDETYSVLCAFKPEEGIDEKKASLLCVFLVWFYWMLFGALGGLIGQLITFNTAGIDFAMTALFISILADQLKNSKTKLPAVLGVASSVICIIVLGPDYFILPSLSITVILLILLRRRIEPMTVKAEPAAAEKERN